MPTGDFPPPDGMKWTDAAGWVSASSVPTPMTGPVTTEALREALLHACFDPGAVVGPRGGLTTDEWRADACMKQLAPLLASLQQVTAERDEARAKQRDMHRRAQKAESFRERHRGGFNYLMNGKRKERFGRRAAEASLATATSELARLRAEGEAKDRALRAISDSAADGLCLRFDMAEAHQLFQNIRRTALARAATAREGA